MQRAGCHCLISIAYNIIVSHKIGLISLMHLPSTVQPGPYNRDDT
jgi:hypothetical protein